MRIKVVLAGPTCGKTRAIEEQSASTVASFTHHLDTDEWRGDDDTVASLLLERLAQLHYEIPLAATLVIWSNRWHMFASRRELSHLLGDAHPVYWRVNPRTVVDLIRARGGDPIPLQEVEAWRYNLLDYARQHPRRLKIVWLTDRQYLSNMNLSPLTQTPKLKS
jgi:hypothetical protein